MIKIENTEVVGWEAAIRGMRNPMNSWEKSDTYFFMGTYIDDGELKSDYSNFKGENPNDNLIGPVVIGSDDHDLMMRLCKAGSADAKFRRMIICYADITAPLYMLKEMDTYRMGVEKNSCSTMHKIQAKEFDREDFSYDRLEPKGVACLDKVIDFLNFFRGCYHNVVGSEKRKKDYWYNLIQLLPSSYNQRRTYMFSYEALSKIYRERRNHKLDEWHQFCDWVETLPYSEIITLKEEVKTDE